MPVAELSGLTRDANGQLLAVADDSYLFSLGSRTKEPVSVLPLTGAAGQKVDSEAVVVDRDGTRLITDETQPSILRFTRSGHVLDCLPVPDALKVASAGRATHNLTFEGLTLLPGGAG
ncbi:esterase-like activity of phytase family protein [Streptomyces sp. NBC_01549]|uniref:esterase-like activity of phytase family protein n=1 Tax=unclassified Streptomyces TaxID=2593676 RepID=UPI00225B9471|nr:esterase-like activity of phytase family protein [Streptomyces sp. NBC_01549]MCX4597459.1 esterase-like activity of phytase family protein [Streptomyces sp. NBC_01549]